MALAVARTVEHEIWSWPDPEVGLHPALRGLGAFSVLVGTAFTVAWGASLAFDMGALRWLLLAAASSAAITACVCLVAGLFVARRARRRAPSSVRVGRHSLEWADQHLPWERVRSIGVGRRLVERERDASCVIVRDDEGCEVWLAVDQPEDALEDLDEALRLAWREATGMSSRASPLQFRVIEGGRADRREE